MRRIITNDEEFMKKALILVFTLLSASVMANDCASKDNYLQGFISDFYSQIRLTVTSDFTFSDGKTTVSLKKNDKLIVTDTNIINPSILVFDLQDQNSDRELPQMIFQASDVYESTVKDLEQQGKLAVDCKVIPVEDQSSQYGRWYIENKLRKE